MNTDSKTNNDRRSSWTDEHKTLLSNIMAAHTMANGRVNWQGVREDARFFTLLESGRTFAQIVAYGNWLKTPIEVRRLRAQMRKQKEAKRERQRLYRLKVKQERIAKQDLGMKSVALEGPTPTAPKQSLPFKHCPNCGCNLIDAAKQVAQLFQ